MFFFSASVATLTLQANPGRVRLSFSKTFERKRMGQTDRISSRLLH